MSERWVIDPDVDAFIDERASALERYDSTRPPGHPYEFHLHSQRVANDVRALALSMEFNEQNAEFLHRLTLVHDIGKSAFPVGIWDMEDKPSDEIKAQRRAHTTEGVKIVDAYFGPDDRRPALEVMRDMMANHHECMDGSGWRGLHGRDLSLPVRILCVADAFDGYSAARPHFGNRDLSVEAVLTRMTVEKKGQFDPEILAKFAEIKRKQPASASTPRTRSPFNAVL